MKNSIFNTSKLTNVLGFAIALGTVSCERDLSEDVVFATFPNDGDVFIDAFSAGLDYFPFVDAGADPEAFNVVTDDVFEGSAAMRFDVPTFGNGFVGATFNTTSRRNLTTFDALTFYAKASQAASIDAIGFGIDGETANKYMTTINGLELTTAWKKYIIPIPDASKLDNETGLFWLAEGASFPGDEGGYTFWIDEVQFENLGTVAQPRPAIFNGQDVVQQSFAGSNIQITGLTQTFNLASGDNQTVMAAPAYFDFISSDVEVAQISESGEVTVIADGTAIITAQINGVLAEGSLTIDSSGDLDEAPIPTEPASNVVSIFSDAYTNIPVEFYNGNFENQGTTGGIIPFGSGEILSYDNFDQAFGFVTTQFTDPTVDLTNQNTIHFDVFIQEDIDPGDSLVVELVNAGPDNTIEVFVDNGGGIVIPSSQLSSGSWVSFDIPLANFTNPTGGGNFTGGVGNRANMGSITFASGGSFSAILVDNIYFYSN